MRRRSCTVETYVPSQRELHEWPSTGKRKWIDRVICPGFLFIRSTEQVRYAIKAECSYILHFHVGSRVRIKSGSLQGLEGCLIREPEKSPRFCIKINLLGYATMEINAALLEEVDPKFDQSK